MQRIEIENFGPIKDVAFDIKPYTIFIGPQASGKSTIARCVYFFQTINGTLLYTLRLLYDGSQKVTIDQFKEYLASKFAELWDSSFLQQESRLSFCYDCKKEEKVEIKIRNGDIEIQLSDLLHTRFNDLHQEVSSQAQDVSRRTPFTDYLRQKLATGRFAQVSRDFDFLPAGRSVFSAHKNELNPHGPKFNDVLTVSFIDSINMILGAFERLPIEKRLGNKAYTGYSMVSDGSVETMGQFTVRERDQKIDELSSKILKGRYIRANGKDYIQFGLGPGDRVLVAHSSSGQQEALWILLYILYTEVHASGKTFTVIEEPEAHLFPEAQRNMMLALTLFANNPNNQLMLTTHSPYILTPLNNLLLAHQIGYKKNEQTGEYESTAKFNDVAKIVDHDLWIDPERFECYYVEDGKIDSVMDREVNMMSLRKLDGTSSALNEEYDKLSELEDLS